MSDAQSYFEGLIAQGHDATSAAEYTKQHFPNFVAAPAPAPAPAPMSLQPQMGMPTTAPMMGSPATMAPEVKRKGRGMQITNGVLGILMSLAIIGYSFWVKTLWDSISQLMKDEYEGSENSDIDAMLNSIDSLTSSFSLLYTIIAVAAVIVLIVSFIQFFNQSWGTKAFLAATGLLLVLLIATAVYEVSAVNNFAEEVSNFDPDSGAPEKVSITMVNGMLGAYCAGPCFLLFSLLAFLGRPKGEPTALQTNPMM